MPVTADQLKALVPTEADLCAIFIPEMNEQPGWTCYPETGGFDILVVHESGRQIGVEAKLQLNAKVADQIVPNDHWYSWGAPGPDHRLVIVRGITEASEGIAKLLRFIGIEVWSLHTWETYGEAFARVVNTGFRISERMRQDADVSDPPQKFGLREEYHFHTAMFDWNPAERLQVPDAVPTLAAGVPAPVQMTPWKMAAVRVLARLRVQGYITAKEISAEGCSPSIWTQRWLTRGPVRAQWVETERTPKFDQQHPELYAVALQKAQEAHAAQAVSTML